MGRVDCAVKICGVEKGILPLAPVAKHSSTSGGGAPAAAAAAERERVGVMVNLTAEARRVVDDAKEEFGVGKQEAVSRILQKWASMPASVRRAFIDRDGDP